MDNLILLNPYRILGVLSSQSLRDIERNVSKFKAFAKINRTLAGDYDFNFLSQNNIDRSEKQLSKSKNLVSSDKTKVQYSLFWFVIGNAFDKIALENLKKGDYSKALQVWEKCTYNKKLSKSNFSSFNNYSSLLLNLNFYSDKKEGVNFEEIKNAIKLKYELISSNQLDNFNLLINADRTSLTPKDVKDIFSEDLIKIFKSKFSNTEISKLFEGLDQEIYQSFSGSLIKQPISNISNAIEVINNDLETDHNKGLELGKKLIKLTSKDVKNLKELVGEENYEFQMICDKLANQIMQCGILYYNKTYDHQGYISSYKYALSISYSEKTKTRANNTIKHCEQEIGKNTCSNCNTNNIDRINGIPLRIYKETSRSFWNRSVQFQYIDLKLHFCKQCNKIYDKNNSMGCAFNLIGLALGIAVMYFSGGELFILGLLIFGASWLFSNYLFPNNMEYNHPTLKDYEAKGWSTSKPVA